MNVVSMHQAKSNLSQLVKKALQGEDVYIGAYGKVEAKIVAVKHFSQNKNKKIIGLLKGKLHIPDDFDEPLSDEIIAEFAGKR